MASLLQHRSFSAADVLLCALAILGTQDVFLSQQQGLLFRVVVEAASTSGATFLRCPDGKMYSGSQIPAGQNYDSLVSCLITCSRLTDCLSINVCPVVGGEWLFVCIFFSTSNYIDDQTCAGLGNAMLPACFHMMRMPEEVQVTPPPAITTADPYTCDNGATYDPLMEHCNCTLDFAGVFCERYPFDCAEIWMNGARSSDNGIYIIQPANSTAFMANCTFGVDVWTNAMVWRDYCSMQINSMSYGELLVASLSNDCNFIGLPNMHSLLQQADYDLRVTAVMEMNDMYIMDYTDFSMQSAAQQFAISYNSFFSVNDGANGWPATPAYFYTSDNYDPCAATRSFSGWMASDCTGDAVLFQTNVVQWPLTNNNLPNQVYHLAFDLQRTNDIYLGY